MLLGCRCNGRFHLFPDSLASFLDDFLSREQLRLFSVLLWVQLLDAFLRDLNRLNVVLVTDIAHLDILQWRQNLHHHGRIVRCHVAILLVLLEQELGRNVRQFWVLHLHNVGLGQLDCGVHLIHL